MLGKYTTEAPETRHRQYKRVAAALPASPGKNEKPGS